MSKKKKNSNIVYSTNPDFNFEKDNNEFESINKDEQELKVLIDRKQRKGKSVTLIKGFIGSDEEIKDLSKLLKSKCGVGGTAKNNEILIQGEFKSKIFELLIKMGYSKTKQIGG